MHRSRRALERALDQIEATVETDDERRITAVVINHHSHGSGTFEAAVDPDQPDPGPVSSTTAEQPGLTVTINHFERAEEK